MMKVYRSIVVNLIAFLMATSAIAARTNIPKADFSKIATFDRLRCTLTFLTPTVGITAAHCAAVSTVLVSNKEQGADYIPIEKVVIHPMYRESGTIGFNVPTNILGPYFIKKWPYDLALVKLSRPARTTIDIFGNLGDVVPLTGPEIHLDFNGMQKHEKVIVISLGQDGSKPLQKIDLTVKRKANKGELIVIADDSSDQLLPGDSGSPIFRETEGSTYELVGIVSSGFLNKPFYEIPTFQHTPRNEDISKQAFIIDLASSKDWVETTLKELSNH